MNVCLAALFASARALAILPAPRQLPGLDASARVALPRRTSMHMICDWDAMMAEVCEPSALNDSLESLADGFSPAEEGEGQRRESLRILNLNEWTIALEEVLCTDAYCIAITYEVDRQHAQATMQRSDVEDFVAGPSQNTWRNDLRDLLNASPGVVHALARLHAPRGCSDCLRSTDELEKATVRQVLPDALVVELTMTDLAQIDEHSTHMPRRTHTAHLALPRVCDSADCVEAAVIEMLRLDSPEGPEMGI